MPSKGCGRLCLYRGDKEHYMLEPIHPAKRLQRYVENSSLTDFLLQESKEEHPTKVKYFTL
eukprot:700109-Amphidinium_carterae.1